MDLGNAESLGYPDQFFDVIVCRYAFHHFERKEAALKEMVRVLRGDGLLRLENIAPEKSPDWWIYKFFPSAAQIDAARFWPVEAIRHSLEELGLEVSIDLFKPEAIPASLALKEIRNRDASQVTLISDREFLDGISRIEEQMPADRESRVDTGLTLVNLVARKPET